MELQIIDSFEAMSHAGAEAIVAALARVVDDASDRPVNVVFSSGRSPTRVYEILADDYLDKFAWSRVALFQMDEYLDPNPGIELFSQYLTSHVIEPLNLSAARLLSLDQRTGNHDCWQDLIAEHERDLLVLGGLDLVVHGIGENGHLGFNEPGSSPTSPGRVVELTTTTRSSICPSPTPTHGVTMGLSVLLAARESIVLASGLAKADAIAAALDGPVSAECPASLLRTGPRTTVIVDREAASGLH